MLVLTAGMRNPSLLAIHLAFSLLAVNASSSPKSTQAPPVNDVSAVKIDSADEKKTEKFVTRTIDDRMQGIPFGVMRIPEGWEMESEIRWNYADVSLPVTGRSHAWNPKKPEEVSTFPQAAFYWLQGAAAFNEPGTRTLGQVCLQPLSPAEALRAAILRLYRTDRRDLQIVGARDMPELPAALGRPADPNQHGVGIKVSYSDHDVSVEEEFYAIHYINQIPYDGPQGRTIQINWGLDAVHSFKAPQGTLDARRGTYAFIMKSIRVNPRWKQRTAAIQEMLNQQFNANLARGYASIQAAGQLSRQISANNDAMLANIDRQLTASSSNGSAPTRRGGTDKFDDYVRGVETMDDPYYGTSQHSTNEQYHWTDGYGNYQHSNDASFDPNARSNIPWQPMTPTR